MSLDFDDGPTRLEMIREIERLVSILASVVNKLDDPLERYDIRQAIDRAKHLIS